MQGEWTEAAFLALDLNRTEWVDGVVEVLPMPTWEHQTIASLLWLMLRELRIDGRQGRAATAPFKLRVRPPRQVREPDVLYLAPANLHRFANERWEYADLVVEVVSTDDPERDHVEKRADHAAAGIPEYWIIDPRPGHRTILALALDGPAYREAGTYREGDVAASPTLAGFAVDVADLFRQAEA